MLKISQMNMQENQVNPSKPQAAPLVLLLFLMLFCIGGVFVGQFIGFIIGKSFGIDLAQIQFLLNDSANRLPILLSQFAYSLMLFVVAPYIFLSYFDRDLLRGKIVGKGKFSMKLVVLTVLVLFSYFPVSAYLVEWNKNMSFPESWAALEQVLKSMEDLATELTQFVVDFDSFGQFLLGVVVIALLPAIGEEFLFRGIIQSYFGKIFKNMHLAIWVSAFIFSAFHFQFYGLVPRMVLGALFGYLFFWSGRLVFAMIAHFINNGVTLLLVYLYHQEMITTNIEESQEVSLLPALTALILTSLLMFAFKKYAKQDQEVVEF